MYNGYEIHHHHVYSTQALKIWPRGPLLGLSITPWQLEPSSRSFFLTSAQLHPLSELKGFVVLVCTPDLHVGTRMMFGIMSFCEEPVNSFRLEDRDLRIEGTYTFLTGGVSGMHSIFFLALKRGGQPYFKIRRLSKCDECGAFIGSCLRGRAPEAPLRQHRNPPEASDSFGGGLIVGRATIWSRTGEVSTPFVEGEALRHTNAKHRASKWI